MLNEKGLGMRSDGMMIAMGGFLVALAIAGLADAWLVLLAFGAALSVSGVVVAVVKG